MDKENGWVEITDLHQHAIKSIKEYPSLYKSHAQVLRHVFHCNGNGYEFEDGKCFTFVYENWAKDDTVCDDFESEKEIEAAFINNAEWLCTIPGRVRHGLKKFPRCDELKLTGEYNHKQYIPLFSMTKGMDKSWYDGANIYLDSLEELVKNYHYYDKNMFSEKYIKRFAEFLKESREHIDSLTGFDRESHNKEMRELFNEILEKAD